MKKEARMLFILECFIFVVTIQFANADVLSINSGGSGNIIINPESFLEGFFFGEPAVLSSCGNGILEAPYEECDDGNYDGGDGCSSLCEIEESEEEEGDDDTPRVEGEPNIRIDPTRIQRSVLTNTNIEETIGITNLDEDFPADILIYSSGFDSDLIVSFWDEKAGKWTDSFTLNLSAGAIYELRVRFSSPDKQGDYAGSLFIDKKFVNVTLNYSSRPLLFDSNIIVANRDYIVPQGEKLRTSITLIPIGEKERLDVTLNYEVKDYENKVYLTRSETVLVENQVNFKRNFDTGILPLGSYIIALDLIYPNGVAPSSAHFQIVEGRKSTLFGRIVFFLVNSILIILILILILAVWRAVKSYIDRRKYDEKHNDEQKLANGVNEDKNKEDKKT